MLDNVQAALFAKYLLKRAMDNDGVEFKHNLIARSDGFKIITTPVKSSKLTSISGERMFENKIGVVIVGSGGVWAINIDAYLYNDDHFRSYKSMTTDGEAHFTLDKNKDDTELRRLLTGAKLSGYDITVE